MLVKKIKAFLALHTQAASSSFNALILRPLNSLMTVMVIAIALTLPALFWMLSQNLHQMTHQWNTKNRIALYLKKDLSEEMQESTLKQVQSTPGVGSVIFHSSKDALEEMSRQEGLSDIINNLPNNPFPPMLDVTPDSVLTTQLELEQLLGQLKILPAVDKARLDTVWLSKLQVMIQMISTIMYVLMILLAVAVIFIIGNTLRLSVSNHQEEIRVLKLIGATNAYIMRPFLYTGVWFGLFGAIFAVLTANILMLSLTILIQDVAQLYHLTLPVFQLTVHDAYGLVLIAVILGWIGARLSVLYLARADFEEIV